MTHRPPMLVLSSALVVTISATTRAGDINPPAGAVDSTMVSLEKLAPGRCLNELPGSPDALHAITESGKYFLTADVLVPGGVHGILVDADDVSLDLNGFSLLGTAGTLDGIHVVGGLNRRVQIFSEPVAFGAGRSRIAAFDGDGLHAGGVNALSVSGITAENNGGDGFDTRSECGENGDVIIKFAFCVARSNGAHGLSLGSGAARGTPFCSAKLDCEGFLSCMNGLDGIHVQGAENVLLRNVRCLSNGEDGVDAEMVARGANEGFIDIAVSESNFNGGHGITIRSGPDDAGTTSLNKCYWSAITTCGNGLNGAHCENVVSATFERCSSANNAGVGYYAITQPNERSTTCVFTESSATGNGAQGALLLLPADVDCDVRASDSVFSDNGGGTGGAGAAAGLDIDSSGGAPDPAAPRVLSVSVDGGAASLNSGDGLRVRAAHDVAINTIRNLKATRNSGSGVDIGPPAGAAPLFDIAVNFADIFCSINGADGARVAGTTTVRDSGFPRNTGSGLAISGFPGSAAHVHRTTADSNGGDGISVLGADGGDINECSANGNAGTGLLVDASALPGGSASTGVRVDRCYASHNSVGIAVAGENFVLRCGGSHNTLANLSLDPFVFAGPSVASPSWTETKPYAWP